MTAFGPQSFEPSQIAAFDQIAASADRQMDGEVAWMREHIAAAGVEMGTALVAMHLIEHGTVESLSMSYAWALRRLVKLADGGAA
jgi:hypothetical protein